MLRRLSAGLLATAAFIALLLAATAHEGSAEDLGFKAHCKVQEHRIRLASEAFFHCLLARTVFGSWMPWSTQALLIVRATASSSIPMSVVDSQRQRAWVIAG